MSYSSHRIQKKSHVAFQDMIFFDDEYGNIVDVSKLGASILLHNQVTAFHNLPMALHNTAATLCMHHAI